MSFKSIYVHTLHFLMFVFFIYLVISSSMSIFAIIYSITAFVLIVHIWFSKNDWRTKLFLTIVYLIIMIAQQTFNVLILYSGVKTGILFLAKKTIGTFLIIIPFFALYLNYIYTLQNQFFPSAGRTPVISFEVLKEIQNRKATLQEAFAKSRNSLCVNNLTEVAKDIPRHSYMKYVNRKTLSDEFFKECENSLRDEYLYIVVSSTGSPASELISVFTQKTYNHVSLSFDSRLKTILSYNGGENVYPPGLNREHLKHFRKKDDASVIVYRIKAPREKKQIALNKIREINETGSAYNLVGLVTKISLRPNIMFCSQFIYSILKEAGLEYFECPAGIVKPTDLVEKDYYRKLEFCYEIRFKEAFCS